MKKTFLKLILFALAIFIIGTFYVGLKKTEIYDTKNLIGTNLDNFTLNSLNEDLEINQELIKENQYNLINFWASWCGPCRAEHPILLKLNKEKNLMLLGVNFKDKKDNALKFLKDLGDPYDDLARDEFGKHSINFGIYGIPESILIDKDLVIIKKFIGPISKNDYSFIKQIVRKQ